MKRKPDISANPAELRDLYNQQKQRPMMAELYRRAEARLRKRRKNKRLKSGETTSAVNTRRLRIPMKADTCSNPCRTPFRSCRTVVGAKRRSESLIKGCPTRVKVSPSVLHSFGAPSRGDALTLHPKTSSRRLFGRAVSGGNGLSNSSSRCRRSLRVTDSPARPNRRALD
jgi:hypothetical protein